MKVINIAIVGIGRIGWPMANGEISKYYSDKYKIVAACDLVEERRNRMANTFGCKTYSEYAEMLKQDDIDIVYVATRSCDHHKHALMALKAGKDVLLEKPATISYEEILDLYKYANKEGTPKLYVHQQRRFEDAFMKVMDIVNSGKLGKIYEINTEQNDFQHRDDWQTISEFGGGQLLNWGPHIIDQSLKLLGTSSFEMQSYLHHVAAGGDCEDHLRIRFIGDNDRVVNMCISGGMAINRGRYYQVYGDRGAAFFNNEKIRLRYIDPAQEVPEIISSPETPGAAFGKTGTYESSFTINWIEEEIEAVAGGTTMADFWQYLYDSYVNGDEFPITDEDILSIMRTISAVKAQNKHIMNH